MNALHLNIDQVLTFVSKQKLEAYEPAAQAANKALHQGSGKGNDFLGWLHLPSSIEEAFLADIEATAKKLQASCDVVVVAGIGGSYLGAKAVIDALDRKSVV